MVIKSRSNEDKNYKLTKHWCDDLVSEIGEAELSCPARKDAKSTYALNQNIVGKNLNEIDPGTILIFESVDGWNLVGGPDLISLENHNRYENGGFYVLYCDWHVSYEKPDIIERYPQIWQTKEN